MKHKLINDNNLPRFPESYEAKRQKGVHLSNILSSMFDFTESVIPETPEEKFKVTNLMEMGRIFEEGIKRRLHALYPDRFFEPQPLFCEGIHLTPDFYDTKLDALWDFKFTKKSARQKPGAGNKWLMAEMQIMGYGYASNINNLVLAPCHINGHYDNGDVVYCEWYREYSDSELRENWLLIMNHLDRNLETK